MSHETETKQYRRWLAELKQICVLVLFQFYFSFISHVRAAFVADTHADADKSNGIWT